MKYDHRLRTAIWLLKGPRVLHVGAAGNAAPAARRHFAQQALVDAGFSVLATDVAEERVQWLRAQGFEAVVMNAERIPPDGECFDSIFAGELIEHLSNPGLFLDSAKRRLRSEGRLVLTTPQPFSPLHIALHSLRPGHFNLEHTCWFDAQFLRQLLERHGYRVLAIKTLNDARPEASRWTTRIPSLILASAPGRFGTTLVAAAEISE